MKIVWWLFSPLARELNMKPGNLPIAPLKYVRIALLAYLIEEPQ